MVPHKPRITILRSNPVAPDPRVEKEARALAQFGEVHILAWDRTGKLPKREDLGFAVIERLSAPSKYGSVAILGQLVKFNIWLAWKLCTGPRTIVHACDLDTGFTAAIITRLRGQHFIYDMFDMYAEASSEILPPAALRIATALESWIVRVADATIIVDEGRRVQIKDMRPRNLAIVYNSPEDLGVVSSQSHQTLRVFYAGVLARNRGFEYLARAITSIPETTLLIAGFGPDEDFVESEITSHPNAIFLGKIPYAEVLRYSQESDVLFALYDPQVKNHRFSSPNKLFEAMMLGKPIIVSDGTGMSDIVIAVGNGIVVPYGDEKALAEAIKKLHDPELRQHLGIKGRQAYEQLYGWERMREVLSEVYRPFVSDLPKPA
jgi:glycosyltransferase involved in cell wall biosynthesis